MKIISFGMQFKITLFVSHWTGAYFKLLILYWSSQLVDVRHVATTQYIRIGTNDKIDVDVTGYPQPSFEWKRDGVTVNFNTGRYSSNSVGTVSIRDVNKDDRGNYTLLINQGSARFKNIKIEVVAFGKYSVLQRIWKSVGKIWKKSVILFQKSGIFCLKVLKSAILAKKCEIMDYGQLVHNSAILLKKVVVWCNFFSKVQDRTLTLFQLMPWFQQYPHIWLTSVCYQDDHSIAVNFIENVMHQVAFYEKGTVLLEPKFSIVANDMYLKGLFIYLHILGWQNCGQILEAW